MYIKQFVEVMIDRTLIRNLQERNARLARGETLHADFLKSVQTIKFRNFPENGVIDFKSPVTAIVGRNGTGKSTVLFLAGSAYAPPPLEGQKRTKGKTYNNYIPDSQKDKMPLGAQYGFLYADGESHKYIWHEREEGKKERKGMREWDRRHKTPRKLKHTIFVGFEKTISNGLLLADYYNLSKTAISERLDIIGRDSTQLENLDRNTIETIKRITGKKYRTIQRRTDKYSKLSEFCYGYVVDDQYSDIACGSGEIALIRMIDVVANASKHSLILIDEPENGIHQTAQNLFLEFLIQEALNKNHQVVFTTHSEFFLQNLNSDSIVLLESSISEGTIHPMNTNRSIAFKAISDRLQPKVLAIVEDDIAKLFLSEILESDPSTREQVKIRASLIEGGWKNQVKTEFPKVFTAFKYTQDSLSHLELKPVLVLDGDAKSEINFNALENEFGSKSKIESYLRQYQLTSLISRIGVLSGKTGAISFRTAFKHHVPNFTNSKFGELIAEYLHHFQEHTYFLPGDESPEIVLFEWLKSNVNTDGTSAKTLLALLPSDKQNLLRSFCSEIIPTDYSEKRDFCKKKIVALNSFSEGFLKFVMSQWVLDDANKGVVSELLEKFKRLVD
jgi:predicted ATPase